MDTLDIFNNLENQSLDLFDFTTSNEEKPKEDSYPRQSNPVYFGKSFEYAGRWTSGQLYYNDNYRVTFVVYKNYLLACNLTHTSSEETEPVILYEDGNAVGVENMYWQLVLSGDSGKDLINVQAYIAKLQEEVNKNIKDIEINNKSVEIISKQYNLISEHLDSIDKRNDEIDERNDKIDKNLIDIQTYIENLQEEINKNTTDIEINNKSIEKLQEDINKNATDIETNATSIENINNWCDLISQRLDGIDKRNDDIESTISKRTPWVGSEEEYESLENKDPEKFYFIYEE